MFSSRMRVIVATVTATCAIVLSACGSQDRVGTTPTADEGRVIYSSPVETATSVGPQLNAQREYVYGTDPQAYATKIGISDDDIMLGGEDTATGSRTFPLGTCKLVVEKIPKERYGFPYLKISIVSQGGLYWVENPPYSPDQLTALKSQYNC